MSEENKTKEKEKIAVIRIRGVNKKGKEKNDTLDMLKLYRKNFCVILEKTPSMMGMVKKVSDCVTWGEVDNSVVKELEEKRGEKTEKGIKRFFRLNNPKGGFERKGIKMPFSEGGVLGYRGKKINDLIKRML